MTPPPAHRRTPAELRAEIVRFALGLQGIHEVPAHDNRGPVQVNGVGVDVIQRATGAIGLPWCVSTVQYIWVRVLGTPYANRTAGAYPLASFAERAGHIIRKPVPGCAVVYHIGAGHAGTVVSVNRLRGTFEALEGNEADAVRRVTRNPRQIRCSFILRPELRDRKPT